MEFKKIAQTPKELTDLMVENFKDAAGSIFKITRSPEYIEFEKGLYSQLIVKPIKRISRLLTTDRELLVLFSSFHDQQPRTIETAKKIIESSDGRLEHDIAIIVHADPEGNSKLKNWGREKGIAIIPVYAHKKIPRGEELERNIFYEFFSYDAFDVSGPVSDDSKFYGRRSEALDIARQLQSGQVRSCLGIRKVGKTSIINRIIDILRDNFDCTSVMIDCSRDTIWQMDAARLLYAIAEAVNIAVQHPNQYTNVQAINQSVEIGTSVEHLLKAINASPRPVIIFFDEVDYITPGSATSDNWRTQFNPFWRNFRAVYQEATRTETKFSIFISGVSSKWFRLEAIENIENAALAFIPEQYLSPLQSGASVAMINNLGKTAGLAFDSRTAEYIATTCSNVPYWIRKACSFIHRNTSIEIRPYQPPENEIIARVDAFIETEGAAISDVAISHLFRVYPELESTAVAVHNGATKDISTAYGSILEKYGVINKKSKEYSISGKMMSEGIRLYLDKKQSKVSLQEGNLEFTSLTEWAEELALLNASRNKVEKRLRGIVLNFLRFDALQSKQKGTLFERLIKYVEEPRRSKLKHLTADELIERFNWTDLIRLIEKNWELFQNIFIDKTYFLNSANVINDRFDAHAKDADKADVALYRRNLQWFEESLART